MFLHMINCLYRGHCGTAGYQLNVRKAVVDLSIYLFGLPCLGSHLYHPIYRPGQSIKQELTYKLRF